MYYFGNCFVIVLIIKVKMNTFIALIFTSVVVGLGLGMNFVEIPLSIEKESAVR
ncbi:transporter, gluconate:H+ symporter (GntP) family [Weissella viridescens]|uniref:Transporter, gluconate:H+ symporter (GntP) family n=1 Tax=Weissella viridescens TaxID=1629 RepID=A0A380P160_WEIVI|nr:transporter, gluconate:H+ symporter (GntP) family [Weissella viridescens]